MTPSPVDSNRGKMEEEVLIGFEDRIQVQFTRPTMTVAFLRTAAISVLKFGGKQVASYYKNRTIFVAHVNCPSKDIVTKYSLVVIIIIIKHAE